MLYLPDRTSHTGSREPYSDTAGFSVNGPTLLKILLTSGNNPTGCGRGREASVDGELGLARFGLQIEGESIGALERPGAEVGLTQIVLVTVFAAVVTDCQRGAVEWRSWN